MHGKGISAIVLLSILSYASAQEYTDFYAREADPEAKFNVNHAIGDIAHGYGTIQGSFLKNLARRDIEELAARDPKFKNFLHGLESDVKQWGSGVANGLSSRDLEILQRDPNFKSFIKGVGSDIKQWGSGIASGLSGRDLEILRREAEAEADADAEAEADADAEAKFNFNTLVGDVAKGYGTVQGSFLKNLARRDLEDLYARDAKINWGGVANTLEKDVGWGAAQVVKHLRREAEAEAEEDDLFDIYARDAEAEPEEDDLFDIYARDADAKINWGGVANTLEKDVGWGAAQVVKHLRREAKGVHLPSGGGRTVAGLNALPGVLTGTSQIINAAKGQPQQKRDAFSDDDLFELYSREAKGIHLPKTSGGGRTVAGLNALPGVLTGTSQIINAAQGQQQPQKRDPYADPEIFDYEY